MFALVASDRKMFRWRIVLIVIVRPFIKCDVKCQRAHLNRLESAQKTFSKMITNVFDFSLWSTVWICGFLLTEKISAKQIFFSTFYVFSFPTQFGSCWLWFDLTGSCDSLSRHVAPLGIWVQPVQLTPYGSFLVESSRPLHPSLFRWQYEKFYVWDDDFNF